MAYEVGGPSLYVLPNKPLLSSPQDVVDFCRPMTRLRQEHFRVLCLSTKHYLLKRVTVAKGSVSATLVHPREVFRPAIVASASAIVVVHNHPSGIPEPSHEDEAFTNRLHRVADVIGIVLLDHLVVATGGYYLFKEHGYL